MDEQMKAGLEQTPQKQTKKDLFWEIFRFLLVGGTATVVDYAVTYLFFHFLLPTSLVGHFWATTFSVLFGFTVGLIVNWVLSIHFVFRVVRDKKEATSKKAFLIFTVIGVFGLGITWVGMLLVKVIPSFSFLGTAEFLGEAWKWWLMKCVMTGIVLIWNYLGRKIFVFKS
ncbi:MAG: GtrA family protein [Clostridia bacterium]|nr:GtrA family protein [Clostridia bacterium]